MLFWIGRTELVKKTISNIVQSIHLNLTKYRLSLLNEARKLIENIEAIAKSIAAGSNDLRTVMIFFLESLDVLKSKISGYSNDSNE